MDVPRTFDVWLPHLGLRSHLSATRAGGALCARCGPAPATASSSGAALPGRHDGGDREPQPTEHGHARAEMADPRVADDPRAVAVDLRDETGGERLLVTLVRERAGLDRAE